MGIGDSGKTQASESLALIIKMEKEGNEIILIAKANLKDNELREWFSIMQTKINTLNKRTKEHTKRIKILEKEIKKNGEKKKHLG